VPTERGKTIGPEPSMYKRHHRQPETPEHVKETPEHVEETPPEFMTPRERGQALGW
jgi:hypothetical protein